MQTGGQLRVLQREYGLHQSGHACRCVQVAYVGLQRSDSAVRTACSRLSECIRESTYFDRIADHSPGSMRFDVGDLLGANSGKIQCLDNHFSLAFNARSQIAHLASAIVIDRRSQNHGADIVAVSVRIFKPPQHHNAQAASKNRSARTRIEAPAVAVARKNFAFAIDIAESMRNFDGHSACQRHIALKVEQALAGQVNRNQRSGAGGLHVDAGAAQVKLIGNARGQNVLVVARLFQLKQSSALKQLAVSQQVMDQIGVHARPGKNSDRSIKAMRHVPGVFQSLPRALKKMPVLRIHDGSVSRTEAKERSIEQRHIVEHRGSLNVLWAGQLFGRCAG